MIKKYSKPILSGTNFSGYKEDYEFSITILDYEIKGDEIYVNLSLKSNSELLKNIVESEDAYVCIKWKSNFNIECVKAKKFNESIELYIPKDKLDHTDSIYLQGFIVSSKNITLSNNGEWTDIYQSDDRFEFHKNELLAESNKERIDYKATGDPFVYVVTIDGNDGKGLSFDARKENHICINVGPKLKEAYVKINNKSKKIFAGNIVDSFMVFNAIVYALLFLIENNETNNYKETEWFKSLDHCFDDSNYDHLEDFIDAMSNDMSVDAIYDAAQKMIHNAIEQNLIDSLRY